MIDWKKEAKKEAMSVIDKKSQKEKPKHDLYTYTCVEESVDVALDIAQKEVEHLKKENERRAKIGIECMDSRDRIIKERDRLKKENEELNRLLRIKKKIQKRFPMCEEGEDGSCVSWKLEDNFCKRCGDYPEKIIKRLLAENKELKKRIVKKGGK